MATKILDFAHYRAQSDLLPKIRTQLSMISQQIELVHIQPGKPTQNARVESFHGRLREECLNVSWFENLFDARRKIAAWRKDYNEERPHSSLGYQTPKEFAEQAASFYRTEVEGGDGKR